MVKLFPMLACCSDRGQKAGICWDEIFLIPGSIWLYLLGCVAPLLLRKWIEKAIVGDFRVKTWMLTALTCEAQPPILNLLIKETGRNEQRRKRHLQWSYSEKAGQIKWPRDPPSPLLGH